MKPKPLGQQTMVALSLTLGSSLISQVQAASPLPSRTEAISWDEIMRILAPPRRRGGSRAWTPPDAPTTSPAPGRPRRPRPPRAIPSPPQPTKPNQGRPSLPDKLKPRQTIFPRRTSVRMSRRNRHQVFSEDACIISMRPEHRKINRSLSLQPTLIWQGGADTIALRHLGEQQTFWQRQLLPLSGRAQQIHERTIQLTRYNGPPLTPGQFYEWVIYKGDRVITGANFRVLPNIQRRQINAKVSANNSTNRKQTHRIYQQARLRSDGLTAIFRSRERSTELNQALTRLAARECGDLSWRDE